MNRNRRVAVSWETVLVGAVAAVAAVVTLTIARQPPLYDVNNADKKAGAASVSPPLHGVTIVGARTAPGIPTEEVDRLGNPVLANCTTCHATRTANIATKHGSQLTEFHQGLTTFHGSLACVACHNPADYSQLRLATGEGIAFVDSLQLCAQCHGPQFRDYQNGAHGGMAGHWDQTAGPRVRNHCLACHDAHAPKYQQVMPVFAPRVMHHGGASVENHP